MKKILLLSALFISLAIHAQDFWTEYSTSVQYPNVWITSISIVDQNTTWVSIGDAGSAGDPVKYFSKTIDGGSIWTSGVIDLGPSSDGLYISNIHGVSSSVAYLSAYGVQGGLWKTNDGGASWTKQVSIFSDIDSDCGLVYFWNTNDGVAVGDHKDGYFEMYTTSNGGDLWTRIPSVPAIVPVNSLDYVAYNIFDVVDNTIWLGTTSGRILKSPDKGLTWTAFQSPISAFSASVTSVNWVPKFAFSDLSNGLLQTPDWRLYKTNDGGAVWNEVFYNGVLRNLDISKVPGMNATYISIGDVENNLSERGSSYTIDGGSTWTTINNNPDTNFVVGREISMLDEDHGFAAGYQTSPGVGGVFKWSGGALLRQAQLAVSSFSGKQPLVIAPNPTSGLLTVTGKGISQVEVTDALGKQITITKYDLLNNINLDLDFLTSGIYMLRVTNDEGTFISKVIKR